MNDSLEAGSDSFLDVIANLVGVLIILVVATALRVENTPPDDVAVIEPEPAEAEAIRLPVDPPIRVYFAAEAPLPPIRTPEPVPDARLIAAVARLTEQIEAVPKAVSIEPLRQRLAEASEAADAVVMPDVATFLPGLDLTTYENAAADIRAAIAKTEDATRQRTAQLATISLADEEPESLVHEIRPISRGVAATETETYLMLRGGRVGLVPIRRLERLAANSISSRIRNGMRSNPMTGTVGPVDGFTASYIIQRGGSSAFDDLVGISEPDLTLFFDPVDEEALPTLRDALSRPTPVRDAILRPNTVISAVVYPDSFREARILSEFAQQVERRLALRPLGDGIPISASPNGTRSMVQ